MLDKYWLRVQEHKTWKYRPRSFACKPWAEEISSERFMSIIREFTTKGISNKSVPKARERIDWNLWSCKIPKKC